MSQIFHSVRLVRDIIATLSLGLTPNLIKPLLILFALFIYSWVEVATHSPLYLLTKDFSRLNFSSW